MYASITEVTQKSKAASTITSYGRVRQARRLSVFTAPSTAIFRPYTECPERKRILGIQYLSDFNEETPPTKTYHSLKNF